MLKKIVFSMLIITGIVGCSDVTKNTTDTFTGDSIYLSQQDNNNSLKPDKNIYTCDNDEFFFTDKVNNQSLNFIYGSYSISLLKKPTESRNKTSYSDGLYNLTLSGNNAVVLFNKNQILTNCKLKA